MNRRKILTQKEHEEFMKRAIELSKQGSIIEKTGGVFGAVIVNTEGKIVGEGYNRVVSNNDPTAHAEICAIRDACKKLGTFHLEGCTLYTSAECCPMCLCAAYWAHIDAIFYASTFQDALTYGDFADVNYLAELRKEPEDRQIKCTQILRPEAVEIWKQYHDMPDRIRY